MANNKPETTMEQEEQRLQEDSSALTEHQNHHHHHGDGIDDGGHSEHHHHHHHHEDDEDNGKHSEHHHHHHHDDDKDDGGHSEHHHHHRHDDSGSGNKRLFGSRQGHYYRPGLERLRIILMFFMCLNLFGVPLPINDYVETLCGVSINSFFGFAPIAFFILSGYLVLRESTNRSARIVRAIKRSAIVFGALVIAYFTMSLAISHFSSADSLPNLGDMQLWTDFLVWNRWPFAVGNSIWYVQSLLYAYIVIYFMDKLKLLKFDWFFSFALILFTVVTGEFSGVFRMNLPGADSLSGNFINRALPYILLGSFMHKKIDKLSKRHSSQYRWWIFIGFVSMALEGSLLRVLKVPGDYGHMIGMPVIAVSICVLAFKQAKKSGFEATFGMSRWNINFIYYLCCPVYVLMTFYLEQYEMSDLYQTVDFLGILTFTICFCIGWIPGIIRKLREQKQKKSKKR